MKKKIFLLILFLLIGVYSYSQVPQPPTLISPSDSSIVQPNNVLLDWSDVSSANFYRVQVSITSNFSPLIIDVAGLVNSAYAIPSGILNFITLYYWRVNASNQYGTGQWSSVWRFITVSAPPLPPILLYPPNGAINVSLTPTLDWTDVTGATSYKVQISNVFDTIVVTSEVTIPPGKLNYFTIYYWRVAAINNSGQSNWTSVSNFRTIVASGIRIISSEVPTENKLYNNYPNPFNPITNIRYAIKNSEVGSQKSEVRLIVYDIIGKEIETLVNEKLIPGTYEVTFDGTQYPSGVYFYKLTTDGFSDVKRMVLVK